MIILENHKIKPFACIFAVNDKKAEAQLSNSLLFTKGRGNWKGNREVIFLGPVPMSTLWARSYNQECVVLLKKEGPKREVHAYLSHLFGHKETGVHLDDEYLGRWLQINAEDRNQYDSWTRIVGIDGIIRYFNARKA